MAAAGRPAIGPHQMQRASGSDGAGTRDAAPTGWKAPILAAQCSSERRIIGDAT